MPSNPEQPRIPRNTPAEDAAIQRGIDADPDNPEWTEEMFALAQPAIAIVPKLVEEMRGQSIRHRQSGKPHPHNRESKDILGNKRGGE